MSAHQPEAALAGALDALAAANRAAPSSPLRIGVAVSGGGDSMALLHLAQDWAAARGAVLEAATVDHGLRPEAAAEAAQVGRICAGLGVAHRVLVWRGGEGPGNLQARAREARRELLAGWAAERGLNAVLLGHTADDQAETVLMRLARGSGVDGLAGIDPTAETGPEGAPPFLRPLLGVRREALRDWLRARGLDWIEDPSNEDARFDRIKARAALSALAPLGLTVERLTATAAHMRRARETLWQAARDFAARHVTEDRGDLVVSPEVLLPEGDSPLRVLAAALMWIGTGIYRPRFAALAEAAGALAAGEPRTLAGVLAIPTEAGGARLTREASAAAALPPLPLTPGASRARWDGRWTIAFAGDGFAPGLHVAPLGDRLAEIEGWRETGLPRGSLRASPAIWRGDSLLAAPLAGLTNGWIAQTEPGFHTFLGRQ